MRPACLRHFPPPAPSASNCSSIPVSIPQKMTPSEIPRAHANPPLPARDQFRSPDRSPFSQATPAPAVIIAVSFASFSTTAADPPVPHGNAFQSVARPFASQRNQSRLHKRRFKTHLFLHFHKSVIGNHRKNCASRANTFPPSPAIFQSPYPAAPEQRYLPVKRAPTDAPYDRAQSNATAAARAVFFLKSIAHTSRALHPLPSPCQSPRDTAQSPSPLPPAIPALSPLGSASSRSRLPPARPPEYPTSLCAPTVTGH